MTRPFDFLEIAFVAAAVLLGMTVHEAAHGYAAFHFGDRTAFDRGRLTFNPLRHVDPFGTVILPLFLLFAHAPFLYGYAKPVPVKASALRNPKRDMALVAAAGPAGNLALAILFAGPAMLVTNSANMAGLGQALSIVVATNIVMAFFNILPIPPLDGSNVLAAFLPSRLAGRYLRLGRYRFLPLILIFLGVPLIGWLVATLVQLL
jgi:Zn-dependent protease